jgi:hypothetical protein
MAGAGVGEMSAAVAGEAQVAGEAEGAEAPEEEGVDAPVVAFAGRHVASPSSSPRLPKRGSRRR